MKTSKALLMLAFLILALKTEAQTNFILVTNMVKPGPYLRVIDGVTYSVAFTNKWAKFQQWEQLGQEIIDPGNSGDTSHFCMGNYQVIGKVTFITIIREHFHNQPDALPYKTYDENDHVVAVLN